MNFVCSNNKFEISYACRDIRISSDFLGNFLLNSTIFFINKSSTMKIVPFPLDLLKMYLRRKISLNDQIKLLYLKSYLQFQEK